MHPFPFSLFPSDRHDVHFNIQPIDNVNVDHELIVQGSFKLDTIVVSQTKITLVLNATTKEAYCWSNRIHLMLGSGAFCLTDYIQGLEKSYVDGEECIFVKNLDRLKENIDKWIRDDKKEQREEIRLNGYKKAHAEHSYENRIKSLISNIES